VNEKELNLDFGTDGVIRSIYDDKLVKFSEDVGDMAQVCRLSHVEWEELGGKKGWTVRAAHDTELAIRTLGPPSSRGPFVGVSRRQEYPVHVFETREEALKYEVRDSDQLMPPKEKR
jgi:hypothetical protein